MKTLISFIASLFIILSGAISAQAFTPSLPPCATEDSVSCFWDATTMGNGQGSSFVVDSEGTVTYTSPAEAHTCADGFTLTGERECTPSTLPACEHEDGSGSVQPCIWDAQAQGNGLGTSIIHTPEVAEVVTSDVEAQAWALFDAVNASDLLPDTSSTVTFSGHSTTAYPLTADTITVWDLNGNHYQFTITA